MNLRHNRYLRAGARRIPLVRDYEQRMAKMQADIHHLQHVIDSQPKLFAPVGHFYSPIPPVEELQAREAEIFSGDPRHVPGVDLREDAQWALLDELAPLVGDVEFAVTEADARECGARYWTDNPSYADGDALFLTLMLRHFKPNQMMELGCGYSSACTLDARERYLGGHPPITFVDPYPELLDTLVREDDRDSVTILPVGTEAVDLAEFARLEAGDILFIDSTHVARPGNDVNRIFFDILPALNPGVIVHLHDIFPRFEYPAHWVYERRGWTEQYVLHGFLQYNRDFEILLWPVFLDSLDATRVRTMFPHVARNTGGSFWFRKVT